CHTDSKTEQDEIGSVVDSADGDCSSKRYRNAFTCRLEMDFATFVSFISLHSLSSADGDCSSKRYRNAFTCRKFGSGDADVFVAHEEHVIRKRNPQYHDNIHLGRRLPRAWIRPYVRPLVRPYAVRPFVPPALRPSLRVIGR
ncbi:hypothetical protein M514_23091, partial [Trichuris suis]